MEQKKKKNKINFKYNLEAYWEIIKNYKKSVFLLLFVILIVNIADLVNSYLLKTIVDQGTAFIAGTLTSGLFIKTLLLVAGIYIFSQLIFWFGEWFRQSNIVKIETGSIYDLKKKYFDHIIGLSHNFYTSHKTGSLISRLVRGGSAIERMTDSLVFNGIPLLFQFGLIFASLMYFDTLTAIIVLGVVIAFVSYSLFIQKIQAPYNIVANTKEDSEKATISDIFTNIDSIKYFGKESYIKKKFSDISTKTRKAFFKSWIYYRYMSVGQMIILGIGTFLLIYFSATKVLAGQMTIGTLVFIYSVYGKLLGPLYGFVYGIREFYRAMADFQDLFEYGKIEPEIKDRPGAKNIKIKEGRIEFRNMGFHYGKREIFSDFNLKVNPNQKVAIIGHSGSGKTTLIKLLYRLYDVDSGSILIDGKDIRNFKHESLRSEMSVVPQECVLFDDTVYNNIAFSRPTATRAEILKAMKFAQLDKIVLKFPNKEKTIVGERGIKLSGGEKQRVSIARAILANKQILVLDEATSSLDSQTEYDIQQYLKELMKGRTSIVIAHRLSTIMSADKIVVMKKGEIVQAGTHNELIKQPGEYKHLWNLQKGGYIK